MKVKLLEMDGGDIFLQITNNVHERLLSLASWMGLDTAAILDFLRKNLNNMDAYFELQLLVSVNQ